MSTIAAVRAREILDCKCRPMVEAVVTTSNGAVGRGSAPTGQTVGAHEAFLLRDNNPSRYRGLGVRQAVENVNSILGPKLIGMDVEDQTAVDAVMVELDGTPDKSRLGGNSVYATSVAVLCAAAAASARPVYRHLATGPLEHLPVPSFNVINGGKYELFTQPFNEFLFVPHGYHRIDDAIEVGIELFELVGEVLRQFLGRAPSIGSSYGYAAPSGDPRTVLELLREAVWQAGEQGRVSFAIDCASSGTFDPVTGTYLLGGERATREELIDYVGALCAEFDLVFVEDLLDQDDWEGFRRARAALTKTILLGDDLTVTDPARLRKAADMTAVDGFVLKPNQVGTISQTRQAFETATRRGLITVPSGRSGGSIDDIVTDLSVAFQVPFQKNGAPRSGERIEKLNFLLRAAEDVPDRRMADLRPLLRFDVGG